MTQTQDSYKKIAVLIPCYNEEKGIGEVVARFPREKIEHHGYLLDIIVIDNNSSDRTAEVATQAGARVISELKKGKGNAMRTGFAAVPEDAAYVVMLDGDATYRPEEVLRLVELLDAQFCTAVVGSRLGGRITPGSMTALNRAGNWFFAHIVRYVYRVNVTDVLTGYFAWTREALLRLHPHLTSSGFAIEMEMVTKMAKLGEDVYAVPISYEPRAGHTNLRPFYDGFRILMMFMRNLFWQPEKKSPFLPEGGRVQGVTGI